jgi:hypothetical protein
MAVGVDSGSMVPVAVNYCEAGGGTSANAIWAVKIGKKGRENF